jgi:chromosome segregation ATPase
LLVWLLLLLSVATCSAQSYQTTDQQLTRLEAIFAQLSSSNQQLLSDLAASNADLKQARQRLEEYQRELATLQADLLRLRDESRQARSDLQTANDLLRKANESLTRYEREVQAEIRSLKMQRAALGVLALILATR